MKRGGSLKRRRGLKRFVIDGHVVWWPADRAGKAVAVQAAPRFEVTRIVTASHYTPTRCEFRRSAFQAARKYAAFRDDRKPLTRKARLRPVTADAARRKRRSLRQYGSLAFRAWLHYQPCQLRAVRLAALRGLPGGAVCVVYDDRNAIEACHVRPRGSGQGVVDDRGRPNVFSACPGHHDWQGCRSPERVKREAGIDLWAVARRQAAAFAREAGRCP